jgi:hypothetical protein
MFKYFLVQKGYLAAIDSLMYRCTLSYLSLHAHRCITTDPSVNYEEDSFEFQKLPGYKLLKSYLICCVVWLETGDHVDWEMITVLDDTFLETTTSINFRCPHLQP